MRILLLLAYLLITVLAQVYVYFHLWKLLPLPLAFKITLIAFSVLCFLGFGVFLSHSSWSSALITVVYKLSTSWLFVMLYLVLLFLLLDLGHALHIVPDAWLYNSVRGSVGITVLMLVVFIGGNRVYHTKARRELTLNTTKPLSRPLKLVLLSDLHIGYHINRQELHTWIEKINAENPDAVLIGGDIIDNDTRPVYEQKMYEEFRMLKAPVYACLGNHEYFSALNRTAHNYTQFYKDAGICLLKDSTAVFDNQINIIGRDDKMNPRRLSLDSLATRINSSLFTLELDHQPYDLPAAERNKIDFEFCGHTHYGQMWPLSWITRLIFECAYGSYQRGNTRYYVSSGMGIWGGKFRIGTRSEYLVLNIQPQNK